MIFMKEWDIFASTVQLNASQTDLKIDAFLLF